VAIDEQENKSDNADQVVSFNEKLLKVVEEYRAKLTALPDVVGVSTKPWRSQNTTVIVARLDRKKDGNWKEIPSFLKALSNEHELVKHKPPSMTAIYHILDDKQNILMIDGKEVVVCVQRSGCSRQNSITSLAKPSNVIKPTKSHAYEHNADQLEISEAMQQLSTE